MCVSLKSLVSHEQKRLLCKVTGHDFDGKDSFDFWCARCGIGRDCIKSYVMKGLIAYSEKEAEKMRRFPGEYNAILVQEIKESYPELLEMIRMMEDDPNDTVLVFMRRSKTYKWYPASMSDEDRLFMTFYSWNQRLRPITDVSSSKESYEAWDRFLDAEGVPGVLDLWVPDE